MTMRHDEGIIRIRISASSEEAAIAKVCRDQLAPRRAVQGVKEGQKR